MANGNGLVTLCTRCILSLENGQPCGHIFKHYPIDAAPIVGQSKNKTVKEFVLKLMEHLQKVHPQNAAAIFLIGQNVMGFLALRGYETQDAALLAAQQEIARYLRGMTRIVITDDEITTAVAKLGFTMEDPQRQPVIDAMKHMRDYLTESPTPADTCCRATCATGS